MTVPYWVKDAIFYQIFPDRFANGDPNNDPPNVEVWGAPPTASGFQGGDLRGIIERFDYLLDLGVNALYLNPIFQSPSNHRYSTQDYFKIDPRLGDMNDFEALLEVAHINNVRVILDGVFNHCSRGFFPFVDVLENQDHSAYRDWFHIHRFPLDAYTPGDAQNYLGWWGHKSLPKFNTDNPKVRHFLKDVARYWIQKGADGWRVDVPNEIDDDSFWAEFRQAVKRVNQDAYLFGEIWVPDPRWVGNEHFDGLMNYPLRDALLDFLNGGFLTISQFADKAEQLLKLYPRENVYAMYVTLGSHDTERLRTMLGGEVKKVKLAFSFLYAYPGTPGLYYGDEIGLCGGKDPQNRGAFPWDPNEWRQDLRAHVQRLITARKQTPALRRGDFQRIFVDDRRHSYAFVRSLGDQKVVVVLNASAAQRHLRLPVGDIGWSDGRIVHDLLGEAEYLVSGEDLKVSLPAWGSAWIC